MNELMAIGALIGAVFATGIITIVFISFIKFCRNFYGFLIPNLLGEFYMTIIILIIFSICIFYYFYSSYFSTFKTSVTKYFKNKNILDSFDYFTLTSINGDKIDHHNIWERGNAEYIFKNNFGDDFVIEVKIGSKISNVKNFILGNLEQVKFICENICFSKKFEEVRISLHGIKMNDEIFAVKTNKNISGFKKYDFYQFDAYQNKITKIILSNDKISKSIISI